MVTVIVSAAMRMIPALAVLAVLAAGCGAASGAKGKSSVVAAFYPLAFVAEEVGGPRVDVHNLTPPGAEPHDIELTPGDVGRLQEGDVVLYLSHGFQPAVQQAVDGAHGKRVDVLAGLDLRRGVGDEAGKSDPHVWLDPVLFARIVRRIGSVLGRPARGAALGRRVLALDGEYRSGLAQCKRRDFVTSHAAFGYLAARYGLRQIPITGIDPESEPSPQRLRALIALVRREHVTTVFFERLVSARLAETVARDAHARTAVLDPIEGLTPAEQSRGDTYLTLMRRNLRELRSALGSRSRSTSRPRASTSRPRRPSPSFSPVCTTTSASRSSMSPTNSAQSSTWSNGSSWFASESSSTGRRPRSPVSGTTPRTSMFDFEFMRLAFAAGAVVGLLAPVVGFFLVQRQLSLIGDGIGPVAVAGVAAGYLIGISPVWTALVAAIVGAGAIEWLRAHRKAAGDQALALVFYTGIAGGVVLISSAGALNANLFTYLFGSILTVSRGDLLTIALLGFGALALIAALMVLPVIAAQRVAWSLRSTMALSIAIGLGSVLAGLTASYYGDLPPGGTIVLTATAFFLAASGIELLRARH